MCPSQGYMFQTSFIVLMSCISRLFGCCVSQLQWGVPCARGGPWSTAFARDMSTWTLWGVYTWRFSVSFLRTVPAWNHWKGYRNVSAFSVVSRLSCNNAWSWLITNMQTWDFVNIRKCGSGMLCYLPGCGFWPRIWCPYGSFLPFQMASPISFLLHLMFFLNHWSELIAE